MPLVRDIGGRTSYVSPSEFYTERPEDFFKGNSREFELRISRAEARVLEAIRFAEVPLAGRGLCHEYRLDDTNPAGHIEQLANFVDSVDGKRARKVRSQRRRKAKGRPLAPGEWRAKSPQHLSRRRSALFGGSDIPPNYFDRKMSQAEIDRFVELMRWYLIEEAICRLYAVDELWLVGDTWYVPVSSMDNHRSGKRKRHVNTVKDDRRPFHGRPNRDRSRTRIAA